MRITLIGYGKMGRMIEELILKQGKHTVAGIIQSNNADAIKQLSPATTDAVIEFTTPHAVMANIEACLERKVPIVVGSTGWYDKMDEVKGMAEKYNTPLIWASNFSIGVNLFFRINQFAASLLSQFPDYDLTVKEVHHTQKKDAPSGTAISIARQIADAGGRKFEDIAIEAERTGDVVGYHSVKYTSAADEIFLSHNAFNRTGFALGAIHAAELIVNKKGVFEFKDLINL